MWRYERRLRITRKQLECEHVLTRFSLCLCFFMCKLLCGRCRGPQFSFLWPSMDSHRIPQCSAGAKGSLVWVYAGFIVSSMPHPQWHERHLAGGEMGEGGNRSSWSALSRELFHCIEFHFVPLYQNNNRNMRLLSQCFSSIWSLTTPSPIHGEVLLLLLIIGPLRTCPLLTGCATMF